MQKMQTKLRQTMAYFTILFCTVYAHKIPLTQGSATCGSGATSGFSAPQSDSLNLTKPGINICISLFLEIS